MWEDAESGSFHMLFHVLSKYRTWNHGKRDVGIHAFSANPASGWRLSSEHVAIDSQ